jgi:integrase
VQPVEGGFKITIDKQLTRESKEVPVDTKGAARSFEVPASVWQIIERHADKGKSAFVFTNRGKPLIVDEVSKLTARICEKAGLPSIDFHDLRAFAASSLIGLGVDPFTVMEILGHTDLRTTSIYIDTKSAQKKAALLKLAESLKMVDGAGK